MTSAQSSAAYRARQLAKDPDGFRARSTQWSATYRVKAMAKDRDNFLRRHNATHKAWREKNLERERARCRAIAPEKRMFYDAKHRAKKLGLPFNVELSDIVIPILCPVLGIPIERGRGKLKQNSPTLDRAVPSLGYVKGNVTVISFRANTLKNDASVVEIEKLLLWMRDSLLKAVKP